MITVSNIRKCLKKFKKKLNHSVSCIHSSNVCIMSDKKASIIQSNEMMISEGKKNKCVN